jgi:anti-sigma B factor antagonist
MNAVIEKSKTKDTINIVRLSGRLDAAAVGKGKSQLIENFFDHGGPMVLNLSEVTFIDSTGLGMLVSLHKLQVELGQQMVLCEVNDQVRLLLELTRLNLVFDIYDSKASALKSLG